MSLECDRPLQLQVSVRFPNKEGNQVTGTFSPDMKKESTKAVLKKGIKDTMENPEAAKSAIEKMNLLKTQRQIK